MLAKKTRDSNFELLRIISMIMIVMHHITVHSGIVDFSGSSFVNLAFYRFFILGGKIAVNAFVLISGYFLVKSKFKPEKLFSLVVQVFLYSTVIYLVFVSLGRVEFDLKEAVYNFLPLSTNRYWFMSCYVLMYILSPFVNIMLKKMTQMQHLALIAVLFVVCSILPLAFERNMSNTAWFLFLYISAAYVALYPKLFEKKWLFITVFVVSYLLIVLLKIFKDYSLYNLDSPICYICSASLFVMFKNIKIKHSPVINLLSSATLGVYLIHDNNYMRPFLWGPMFKVSDLFNTSDFWWKATLTVALVYITCTVIELLRQRLFLLLDRFVKYSIYDAKRGRFIA